MANSVPSTYAEDLAYLGAFVRRIGEELEPKAVPVSGKVLTVARPVLAESGQRVGRMSEADAKVIPFPVEKSETAAVRLALASILATSRPTQLDVARCGVNMRRAAKGLTALRPREGAPSPVKAIEELRRACEACAGCRGI
jgi:hypothetical protein